MAKRESKSIDEAAEALREAWPLAEGRPRAFLEAHLQWSEAILQQASGHLAAARSLYARSRQSFLARDMAYHAAVVSVDLAILHQRERRPAEALELIGEIIPLFATLRNQQTIWPALRLLVEAHRESRLPISVMQSARRHLERLGAPASIIDL